MASTVVEPEARQHADVVTFGAHLRRWRHRRSWSQRELGTAAHFSREYVALIERGERRPTAGFVERAEAALGADGALRSAYAQLEPRRAAIPNRQPTRHRTPSTTAEPVSVLHHGMAGVPTVQSNDIAAVKLALDALLREVTTGLDPEDPRVRLDNLARRYADLLGCSDHDLPPEEAIRAAALGLSECVDLLRRLATGELRSRVTALAARFASVTADGLTVLGYSSDAQGWYAVAEQLSVNQSMASTAPDSGGVGTAMADELATDAVLPVTGSRLRRTACRRRTPMRLQRAAAGRPPTSVWRQPMHCGIATVLAERTRRPARAPPSRPGSDPRPACHGGLMDPSAYLVGRCIDA